jgi:hypothetical protein
VNQSIVHLCSDFVFSGMADNSFNSLFNDYNGNEAREFRAHREATRKEALDRAREARLRAEEEAREAPLRAEQEAYEAAIEKFKNDEIARGNAKGFADYVDWTDEELGGANYLFKPSKAAKKAMAMRS